MLVSYSARAVAFDGAVFYLVQGTGAWLQHLLVFAAYLHTRGLTAWEGKRSAWLVVIGFGLIIFAVNFWVAGLRSYA